MDASGNAVAAWMQNDVSRNSTSVWSRRFSQTTGWGQATLLDSDKLGNIRMDQLAVQPSGQATLVGAQVYNDGSSRVWVKRYNPTTTAWAPTEYSEYLLTDSYLMANGGNALPDANGYRYATAAIDGNGNAYAVWQRIIASRFAIWGVRYTPSTGFGTATALGESGAWDSSLPTLAIDDAGNAVAAWENRVPNNAGAGGIDRYLMANRYVASTGGSTTTRAGWQTGTFTTGFDGQGRVSTTERPQISFDASGNVGIAWLVGPATNTVGMTVRYRATSTWAVSSFLLDTTVPDAESRGITVQLGAGNLLLVYPLLDPFSTSGRFSAGRYHLVAKRFVPATGWGPAQRIESDLTGDAVLNGVGTDAAGNAVAVWTQQFYTQGVLTNSRVWSNRFQSTGGWATATRLDTSGVLGLATPSFDTNGNVTVVWQQPLSAGRTAAWGTGYR
jgi:hypothetical protein